VNDDHLLTATRKLLYEHRFVIPGTRRLSNLVQAAISRVEHEALAMIEREIPVRMRDRWLEALSHVTERERRTTLRKYLQEAPAKFAPHIVERQSDKVRRLLKLAVDRYPSHALTLAQLHRYAQSTGASQSYGLEWPVRHDGRASKAPPSRYLSMARALGGITKHVDVYLRTMLIQGARAVIRFVARRSDSQAVWLQRLMQRRHKNVAIVALANKIARVAWAVLTRRTAYSLCPQP
jgi:hypothetical protein